MPDDDVVARMKHHVRGVLANLSAMMPCFSLGGYKLPKVTGKISRAADSPSMVSPPPLLPQALCIVTSFGGGSLQPLLPHRMARGQALLAHPSPEQRGVPELSWLCAISSPVSHHDTEIPFNPSFIEPPSAAWVSDSSFSSSFDTDNEGPEYSVPPREGDVHGRSSSPRLPTGLLGCPGSILPRYRPCMSQGRALGTGTFIFIPSFSCLQGHTRAVLGLA